MMNLTTRAASCKGRGDFFFPSQFFFLFNTTHNNNPNLSSIFFQFDSFLAIHGISIFSVPVVRSISSRSLDSSSSWSRMIMNSFAWIGAGGSQGLMKDAWTTKKKKNRSLDPELFNVRTTWRKLTKWNIGFCFFFFFWAWCLSNINYFFWANGISRTLPLIETGNRRLWRFTDHYFFYSQCF